jgi:hypothetical protein
MELLSFFLSGGWTIAFLGWPIWLFQESAEAASAYLQ